IRSFHQISHPNSRRKAQLRLGGIFSLRFAGNRKARHTSFRGRTNCVHPHCAPRGIRSEFVHLIDFPNLLTDHALVTFDLCFRWYITVYYCCGLIKWMIIAEGVAVYLVNGLFLHEI
ncbi:hypothetical protein PMAYCL1PPCAC_19568, partial [Pristionchus mayeri]